MTSDSFGRLDAAVNCAGIARSVMTLNLKKGTVHSQQDFMNVMQVGVCIGVLIGVCRCVYVCVGGCTRACVGVCLSVSVCVCGHV